MTPRRELDRAACHRADVFSNALGALQARLSVVGPRVEGSLASQECRYVPSAQVSKRVCMYVYTRVRVYIRARKRLTFIGKETGVSICSEFSSEITDSR